MGNALSEESNLGRTKDTKQCKSSNKARTRSSKFVKSYNKKTRMKSNGNGIKSTKAKTEKVLRFGSKSQLSSPSPPFSKQRKRDNKRHRYANDKNQEDESEFDDDEKGM